MTFYEESTGPKIIKSL